MLHFHLQVSQIPNQNHSTILWQQFLFVEDSKGLAKCLRDLKVVPDETLVSFGVSALFTSIPVPVAPEVINSKFTKYINEEGKGKLSGTYLFHTHLLISLLELVLNNLTTVSSLSRDYYCQLQGAAMGSSASPVIASIYMEYFKEMALGPQCPIPKPSWKRYVDDVINIVKKDKVDTPLNHLNSVDPHIKFTMEPPANDGSFPFQDIKCSANPESTISTSVFRKPTHTITTWIGTPTILSQP